MKTLTSLLTAGCLAAACAGYSSQSNAQTRIWGTYYGGNLNESASNVAVDTWGNIFVAGTTSSTTKIASPGSFDSTLTGETNGYLVKFSPTGAPLWATYYGYDTPMVVNAVDTDSQGNVYIAGQVECGFLTPAFATFDVQDKTCQQIEGFLAKFDANGQRIWGTFFGGEGDDLIKAISVNADGVIYLSGTTNSDGGIASNPSQDNTLAPPPGQAGQHYDSFVAKFDTNGKRLWGRYFGGERTEDNAGIECKSTRVVGGSSAVDTCYIIGHTYSDTEIATPWAYDKTQDGFWDAYIARIDGSNGKVVWSTYYGGSNSDYGLALAVDNGLNVYVGGVTYSSNAMDTQNAHDGTYNGQGDMFIAKFSPQGGRLAGTYVGQTGDDWLADLALDGHDNLYAIGGLAKISGDIASPGAYDMSYGGGSNDAVVMKFTSGLARTWSTYYGGNGSDAYYSKGPDIGPNGAYAGGEIAIYSDERIYITGNSTSTNAISSPNGYQPLYSGVKDAYLVQFQQ